MPDLLKSLENNIANFNKEICSFGSALCAYWEDPNNLFTQIFATYAGFSSENEPFTRYIEILEILKTMAR